MKRILKWSAEIVLVAFAVLFVADAVRFRCVQSGAYATPWYSGKWLDRPYVCLRTLIAGHEEHWTENAVGDKWLVRESRIGDKQWWTILKIVKKD